MLKNEGIIEFHWQFIKNTMKINIHKEDILKSYSIEISCTNLVNIFISLRLIDIFNIY